MMYKRFFYLLGFILCAMLISACGFKPYNVNSLPPQIHTMYLQTSSPYDPLNISLRHSLKGMGVKLVDDRKNTKVTLNIFNASFTHDNLNVTSSAQATVYNFTYTMQFNLQDVSGKELLSMQTISITRSLTLSPNEILETSNEVSLLQDEMQRDLINQLFDRLNSQTTRTALLNF